MTEKIKNKNQKIITYSDSGVNIDEGNKLVSQISSITKSTSINGTTAEIGGFGGLFDLKKHEIIILWSIAIPSIFFGFYPHPLIVTVDASVINLLEMYNNNVQTLLISKS